MKFSLTACLLAITSIASAGKVTDPKKVPRNAILLSKVASLTFRAGRKTTSRRVAPVEQLSCAGPSGVCALYSIDTMRCTNEGADYDTENIQWACRADLPEEFKLGSTEVACEGYASSDDPYVLKGSCGVEYRLLLTDKGEERFGGHLGDSEGGEASTAAIAIFFLIFFGVLFFIIKGMLDSCRRNPPRLGGGPNRPPWFGGGGGDDGTDDPPPPYDSHGFNSKRGKSTNYGTAGPSRGGQQQQGWRPGPWTAGLAGAGLGYALGRNSNNQRQTERTGNGWFNQGNGSASSSRSSSSRSTAPSFSSSARHESTGFGSTSRR